MLGEIIPRGSPRRTSIRESSAAAVAKGAARVSQKYPAPTALLRMNPLRSIKSRSPLNDRGGAGRHFELRPPPRDRRFVQTSRSHFLRRVEAVERFQIVAGQKDGRQGPGRRLVLPIHFDGV